MQSVCLLGVTCNPSVYCVGVTCNLSVYWGLHAIRLFTGGYMQSVCLLGVTCNAGPSYSTSCSYACSGMIMRVSNSHFCNSGILWGHNICG